jgi:hypothetical protein
MLHAELPSSLTVVIPAHPSQQGAYPTRYRELWHFMISKLLN